MSEKRSWDIQPKRRTIAQPQQPLPQTRPSSNSTGVRRSSAAPQRAPAPRPRAPKPPRYGIFGKKKPKERKVAPEPALRVVRPAPARTQIPQGRDREPLKARRRRARNRAFLMLSILIIVLVVGAFGSLWLPAVRIQHVQTGGSDASDMQTIATSVLQGTYHYVVPRDSIFFFPEDAIRSQILAQYPDISDVSISRVSFNTIAVVSIPREAVLMWCGPTYAPTEMQQAQTFLKTSASSTPEAAVQPTCYNADAQGIIFSPVMDEEAASSTAIKIYDPLAGNADDTSPLGATIGEASMIPNALQFVKAIESLNVPITTLVIRGDEADLYAQSGTRITYVLGQEEVSAQLAAAAFPSLNLNDGSLQYVDLRFAGKVYFKKVGASGSSEASSTTSL